MDKRATDCTRYATLTSGDIYPANSTGADMTVGEMDEVITRDNAVDFVKCVVLYWQCLCELFFVVGFLFCFVLFLGLGFFLFLFVFLVVGLCVCVLACMC